MDLGQIYTQFQKLLLNNEEVILPNVGVFKIESTPASFLQDGKTILPPSKKLVFENKIIHGARLPWQEDLGAKIVETLAQEESFEVPGFGFFAKTEQGGITFTADESFDFAPDNFSLEAIQLEVNEKPVQNAPQLEEIPQPEEIQQQNIPQQEVGQITQQESVPQPEEPIEPQKNPKEEPEKKHVTETAPPPRPLMGEWVTPKWTKYVAVTIGVFVLLFVLTIIFREQLRPLLENILYTKEELEIIQKWAAQ